MYDYIKGVLTNKSGNSKGFYVTVEASNVGYLFEVTGRDYSNISVDENIKMYSVLIHREDKMSLCGFIRREDRDIFNILTSVSGVGSKMALTLLDEFCSSELIGFVIEGNFKELTRAKGVGPKLAQKIILELKDKLMNYQDSEPIQISSAKNLNSQAIEDAKTVLISFGYEKDEIKNAISKASAVVCEKATAEEILKESLKVLSV